MRLVLITWEDSYGCSSVWEPFRKPFSPPQRQVCRSVGWLVHDGEDCKVVVPHIATGVGDAPDEGCGDMAIPSSAVLSLVDLVEPD